MEIKDKIKMLGQDIENIIWEYTRPRTPLEIEEAVEKFRISLICPSCRVIDYECVDCDDYACCWDKQKYYFNVSDWDDGDLMWELCQSKEFYGSRKKVKPYREIKKLIRKS